MTVAELITELQKFPPNTTVAVWDGDRAILTPVYEVVEHEYEEEDARDYAYKSLGKLPFADIGEKVLSLYWDE